MNQVNECRELIKKLELHTEVLDETPGFILSADEVKIILSALNFSVLNSIEPRQEWKR